MMRIVTSIHKLDLHEDSFGIAWIRSLSCDRNSKPVTALQTSNNPWILIRDVTKGVDTSGLVPSLIPVIPLDRRSDLSGCRWPVRSENQGTSSDIRQ